MKRIAITTFISLLFLVSACSDASEEVEPEDISSSPETSSTTEGSSSPTEGVTNHQLYYAASEDGETWHLSPEETILEKASVPNLILVKQNIGDFKKGTLISHFVDASEMHDWGDERIGYITSEDNGASWSEREMITIENLPERITAVDPCVVQLGDGRMRIYFFDFTANKNLLAGDETDPTFYSAVSEDGVTFEFEGEVYSSDEALITDPEVIWYGERWLLYNPVFESVESMKAGENKIQISESSDGTNFELIDTIDFHGIPGVMHENGTVSMFGCSQNGITRIQSEDGIEFDTDNVDVILETGGCDPDPAKLSDGTYGLILKGFEPKDKPESAESSVSTESDDSVEIIDTHAHIYPKSEEENDEYIASIVETAEDNNVSKIFLGLNARHEPDSPPKFTSEHDDWVLAAAELYPDIIVATLNGFDPSDPDALSYVEEELETGKWKMIGELDLRNKVKKTEIAITDDTVMGILALAGEYEIPVMVHYDFEYGTDREDGIAEFEEALDANPDTTIIYAHNCGSTIVLLMAEHENLYCEQEAGIVSNDVDISRVVAGTDMQVHENKPEKAAAQYKELIDSLREAISSLSETKQKKIGHTNAERIFNL